jgi:poly(3-hydroxybutyrate) depolymerase
VDAVHRICLLAVAVAAVLAAQAGADPAPAVLGAELPAGTLHVVRTVQDVAAAQRSRRADGRIGDWAGVRTGFAGAATYSRGEYVYEDHLWDAYGATDAAGAGRAEILDRLTQADPTLFRAEAVALYAPTGTNYGAGPFDPVADLTEVRVAAAESAITLVARTVVMSEADRPAILVLADTVPGRATHAIPFGSGLTSDSADVALLLSGAGEGTAVDLATGTRTTFPVAVGHAAYDNAIEATIPADLLVGAGDRLRIAVGAGRLDHATGGLAARASGPAIANVAFRHEPVRPQFDKRQALALQAGSIDDFFADIDLVRLRAGTTQSVAPGPGYYARVIRTAAAMSRERGTDGVLQQYGAYVPPGYESGRPAATSLFLHGSGNDAHDLPVVLPGLMRALGDARDAVVLAPQGRTNLSLWEGAGLVDLLDAWADAKRTFTLDDRRTLLTGYSMGGLGAYLVGSLLPDRFAAVLSIAGPVGGNVRSPGVGLLDLPDVRRTFANLRWVPTAIYSGGADNNVPLTNGLAAAQTLSDLGYRHRLFAFPADNHFSPGAVDRWEPALDYVRGFPRSPPNPSRVTFTRDTTVEREVNAGKYSDQEIVPPGGHGLRFDRAYWLSGLVPSDPNGIASVDVRSLALDDRAPARVAEQGAGASPDPFAWTGLRWETADPARTSNRFTLIAHGTSALRLDAPRMRLSAARRIAGAIDTEQPLKLRLQGRFRPAPRVLLDGVPHPARTGVRGLTVELPAGRSMVEILPALESRTEVFLR